MSVPSLHRESTDSLISKPMLVGVAACQTDLTAPQVIRLFKFLIDNIYIQVGSSVFQQAIDIPMGTDCVPMGTDCAPLIVDLFLFSFESDFMKKLIHIDFSVVRKFNKTFRYIDDLLTLSNCQFEKPIQTVFPRIDTRAYISFATPWTRHLKQSWRLIGTGIYLLHVFLAHAHPHYVAHTEVEIHFSLCNRMASQGSERHTQ